MASNENVELIAALYDEENQKPTYEFLQGTIGRSYAFETASRYGIPYSVVKRAKEVYGDIIDKKQPKLDKSAKIVDDETFWQESDYFYIYKDERPNL